MIIPTDEDKESDVLPALQARYKWWAEQVIKYLQIAVKTGVHKTRFGQVGRDTSTWVAPTIILGRNVQEDHLPTVYFYPDIANNSTTNIREIFLNTWRYIKEGSAK